MKFSQKLLKMDSKNGIEKLNSSNYFQWKFKMQMLLKKEDLWRIIIENAPTAAASLRSWNKKDERAQAIIALSVEDSELVHIRDQETAIGTWNALKEAHELDTVTNRISLYKQIASLKMKEKDNIEKHINEFIGLFQKLSDLGATADLEWKIGMFFSSLPSSYSTLITALEARRSDELTWSLVQSKVMDEAIRQKDVVNKEEYNGEKVMEIRQTQKNMLCHFCKLKNHTIKDCKKLWRYNEFKEFNEMVRERKEDSKIKVNEIAEEDDEDDDESCVLCITEVETNSKKPNENSNSGEISDNDSNQDHFEKATSTNDSHKLIIYEKIFKKKITERKMKEQIEELSELFEKLNRLGEELTESFKSAILFNKLPDSFSGIIYQLEDKATANWKESKRRIFKEIKKKRKLEAIEKYHETFVL